VARASQCERPHALPFVSRSLRALVAFALATLHAIAGCVVSANGNGDGDPSASGDDAGATHDTGRRGPTDSGWDGGSSAPDDTAPSSDVGPGEDAASPEADTGAGATDSSITKADDGGTDAGAGAGTSAAPTADELLALVATCTTASKSRYATDDGAAATVDICSLPGAYFWKADMDVDCDGKRTSACSESTDPWFQNQTSASDSKGGWLDASTLPYVVIPLPSTRFDYKAAGFRLGDVVAVIYKGKVEYGVFGDEGPAGIIGEASYAMAKSLGIDPNPATGGTDSGVTYIAFPGSGAVVAPIEDHAKAVALGQSLANKLLGK
jgi:hypothetical protein